ncbi:hypothetical protein BH10BAC2_BH10BAC2_11160 [soil metagenome]
MRFIKFGVSLFLLSILSSCDPGSLIKYEIVNNMKEPIIAKYQFVFYKSGDSSTQEMIIPANSSVIIHEDRPMGYLTENDERDDSILIYWLRLEQGNKLTSQNFKDKKYWKLEKEDEQNGTYKLIVDTALFNEE